MSSTQKNVIFRAIILLMLLPSLASAHHSAAGFFDNSKKIEIAGVVTKIQWRNPHTVFELDVQNEDGGVTQWTVESGALSILRAQGLTNENVAVGDFVRILGDESVRGRPETFGRNMLVASGDEVLLTNGGREYFSTASDVELNTVTFDNDLIASARNSADGIFRVWSRVIEGDTSFRWRQPSLFNINTVRQFPYTETGLGILNGWDPSAEFILGCNEWNMPRLMGNPLPMEFVRVDENILIKFEENDSRRTVYMDQSPDSAPDEHSLMGYSVGHWDGDTLVIRTNGIMENSYEMPVSNQMQILEKFTASADGTTLNYEIVVTDPVMLTGPVTKNSSWGWRPEIEIHSYACEEDQEI